MAEGVGFEPTLGLPLSLISSQVPSTTQPPFHSLSHQSPLVWPIKVNGKIIRESFGNGHLDLRGPRLTDFLKKHQEKPPAN